MASSRNLSEPTQRKNQRMPAFGPIAPYYDELMKPVPYRMWSSYYLLLLAHQQCKPRTILDVCCGTGTMCELLTREGFELTGFDLSPGMIERARAKADQHGYPIRYEVADAAEFRLDTEFDAAFSFFDSLNNIVEPSRLAQAIAQVFEHLVPGGSFVFDLNTAYAFEQRMFDQQNLHPKAKLRYDWTGDYDPDSSIIRVAMTFWRGDERFEEVHVQRAYSEEEIRAMLAEAGFEGVRVFTSYTLNPPRYTSDRLHYLATKPA